MRASARPPRRRWPWIVAAAAIAAVIVAAVIWAGTRPGEQPDEPTAAPTSEPTPSNGTADADPTGCLVEGRDAAMLLATQEAAPHTSNGAVELAAAQMRWSARYPLPTAEEAEQVQASLFAAASELDVVASIARQPNASGGLVADGTTFYASTVPGMWHLESYSDDEAVVTTGAGLVVDGALHPVYRLATTYTLRWEEGRWTILSVELKRTTEDLFAIGTPYLEGC